MNFWNLIAKLFDNFPFRLLISAAIGGIAFACTPEENAMLLRFGITWYIIFVSLIAFLILSLLIWIYNTIRNNLKTKKELAKEIEKQERKYDNEIEQLRKSLFAITDLWDKSDVDILRRFIKNENKPYKIKGQMHIMDGLLASNMINKKIESKRSKVPNDHPLYPGADGLIYYTVYWLKEDVYEVAKAVYEKYGKLSTFDKEEKGKAKP